MKLKKSKKLHNIYMNSYNPMKHLIFILVSMEILTACELITIGAKRQEIIEISQRTPVGTIFLFKAELDSSNIPAATQLLAHPNGNKYLAYEKYELYDDIARLGYIISNKPVTHIKADSLSDNHCKVTVELDYLKTLHFTTAKLEDKWFITSYPE